ncbi:MAG: glycosyltransferase family 2 protein [Gemmataceae bacterium]
MKLSVIVPLYNKRPYVERALASILDQSFSDFELIVVDDGSTDEGHKLVEAAGDPRVRVIRQTNAGPGAARNRGIQEAQGELLAFMDADDEWEPDYLQESWNVLESEPQAATVTHGYFLYPEGKPTTDLWLSRKLTNGVHRLTAETAPLFVVHLLAYMTAQGTVARTEVVRQHGGFYTANRCLYGEDSYLWLKVMLTAPVAVRLRPLWRFHVEASALSSNLRKARPVEPLLTDPDEIIQTCPQHLSALLKKVLAVRAIKTACMLSYWGKWREARRLLRRFCDASAWRWPKYAVAQLAATPAGALAGAVVRRMYFR